MSGFEREEIDSNEDVTLMIERFRRFMKSQKKMTSKVMEEKKMTSKVKEEEKMTSKVKERRR